MLLLLRVVWSLLQYKLYIATVAHYSSTVSLLIERSAAKLASFIRCLGVHLFSPNYARSPQSTAT